MVTNSLLSRAEAFAREAHAGQFRKWSAEPYIVHSLAVKELVALVDDRAETLAAALLHDVLEDTPVTAEALRAEFGPVVVALVVELTDVYVAGYPAHRAKRKVLETERLATISATAQNIKVADIIDNTHDIVKRAPVGFAKIYLKEKAAMLTALTKADPLLRGMAP